MKLVLENAAKRLSAELSEEAENLPVLVPVLMGAGIGFYFSLSREPSVRAAWLALAVPAAMLAFFRLGNSSEKAKRYKRLFALSTLKYIFRKIARIAAFILLFPILGQIAFFIVVGEWVARVLNFSKYVRYAAFLYDNALLSGLKRLFRPITGKFGKYSRDVGKASRAKKGAGYKLLRLMARRTGEAYARMERAAGRLLCCNSLARGLSALALKVESAAKRRAGGILRFAYAACLVLFFCAAGFLSAKFRTDSLGTRLLRHRIRDADITGRVVDVELVGNDFRITLDDVRLQGGGDIRPSGVRIRFDQSFKAPRTGSRVRLSATLLPPFEPSTPTGFNYAFYSYFRGLGASGRAAGGWSYAETQPELTALNRLRFGFLDMRQDMNARIMRAAPYEAAGVLISMMTGDIYAIPKKIEADYRGAGIIHMISISGLHMTAIVGIAFFVVRFLLAFFMPIAARFDTKKLAALAAFAVSLFYLFLSGARIPAQRAFVMTGLGLVAVMLDRSPLSMRFVSIGATAILLLSPEAIANPGFQMSFTAVVALIRIYEHRSVWAAGAEGESGPARLLSKVSGALRADAVSTAVITAAVAPFIIYSFNAFQIYGLLGNALAIPVFAALVMPFILFAFALMPFGLEAMPLKAASFGIEVINWIAAAVASLPFSSIAMKSMASGDLVSIVAGLVLLFAFRSRLKYLGFVPLLAGWLRYAASAPPDVYVDRYGTMFGIRRGGTLEILNLSEYPDNSRVVSDWKSSGAFKTSRKADGASFALNGKSVAFIGRYSDYKDACLGHDIVFATFDVSKARYKCAKPSFGWETLKRSGGAEFHIGDSVRFRAVLDADGARPWGMRARLAAKGGDFPNAANSPLNGLQIAN